MYSPRKLGGCDRLRLPWNCWISSRHSKRFEVKERADRVAVSHNRVETAENFPEECPYVREELGEVYRNHALAREQRMSPAERLRLGSIAWASRIGKWP